MELLGMVDIPIWLTIFILACVLAYAYSSRKQSILRRMNVPGPAPWPFVGNLLEIIEKGIIEFETENVGQYGKYFGVCVGNVTEIVVTNTNMLKEIMVKNFSNFPNRGQLFIHSRFSNMSVLYATGDHWRFLRTLLTPTFSSGKLRGMEPLFHRCIKGLIANIDAHQSQDNIIDMGDIFGKLTLDIICSTALGVDVDCQTNQTNEVVESCKQLVKLTFEKNPVLISTLLIPELKKVYQLFNINCLDKTSLNCLKKEVRTTIEERKKASSTQANDLLQLMINVQKNKHLDTGDINGSLEDFKRRGISNEEIVSNAVIFLLAGYETTRSALTFASYFLATELECQDRLIEEIDKEIGSGPASYAKVVNLEYLDMFISESLRLYPPITRTGREAVVDTDVCGLAVPKHMKTTIPIYALHRMSEYWENPEIFNPERFSEENRMKIVPCSYMPFGTGPRNCVGKRMALMEIKLTLVYLLQRYTIRPSLKLSVPVKLEKDVFTKAIGGIWLKLVRR